MANAVRSSLSVKGGPDGGMTVPLPGSAILLGRRSDNDVVLDETTVSRRHALIMETPSGFVIHDLNTTNGTRVNRTKVGQGQHPLKHGDRIRLAGSEVVLVFRQESPDTELISDDEHDTGAIASKRRSRDGHSDELPEPPMARMDSGLFRLLNSKRGTVVSREEIARQVLTELPEGSQANQVIDESIERIRASIGEDARDPENLVTVGEFGFLMV